MKPSQKLIAIILSFLFFILHVQLVQAQTSPSPATPAPTLESSEHPGIIDEIEAFAAIKPDLEKQIAALAKTKITEDDFKNLETDFESKKQILKHRRLLSSWDLTRVTDFRNSTKEMVEQSETLKNRYFDFLKSADGLAKTLNEKKKIFQKHLRENASPNQAGGELQLLRNAIQDTTALLKNLKQTRDDLALVFEPHSALIEKISRFQDTIRNEIDYFKKERFHKTSPAFYERAFFEPIRHELLVETRDNLLAATQWNGELFKEHLKNIIPALVLFLILFVGFLKLRQDSENAKWQSPLLLAFSVAWLLIPSLISNPFPLENLFFWLVLALLLLAFIPSTPVSGTERRGFRFLIVVYTFLAIIDVIGLPVPVYRILLLPLCAGLGWYCDKQLEEISSKGFVFRLLLQFLTVIFFASGISELFGFHLLAVLLLSGAIKSAFCVFALWSFRHYLLKLVTDILNLKSLEHFSIINKHRFAVYEKTKLFLHALLTGVALVALTRFWGIYDTFGESFENLWNLGLTVQDRKITAGNVITATVAFYIVQLASFALRNILREEFYPRRNISEGAGKSMNSLVHYTAWIMSLFLAFSLLGFELKQFAIIAGALSVGLGFGLQNIVNNFVSGLILLFERPIKIGDTLDIDGEWGTVEKVGLRSTIIRSVSKTQIIIPNSEFISKKVSNLTLSDPDYRVVVPINVAYGSDTTLIQKTLMRIALEHPHVDQNTAPEIYFTGFGNSALQFEIWFWTNNVTLKRRIISDILFEVVNEFKKLQIEMPFPQHDLHLRSTDPKLLELLSAK